ncbi:MAG: sigma-54-dependent Fis family transcriptional regulator [Phycisphaerales bacterium]|nr:sigma-54-dependent Fis family transcriptional regulator [Phycisphaerales bacterium]
MSQKANILIVDDSPSTREILERNLRAEGHDVISCADVSGALSVLDDRYIDLVVTDLRMPGADGMELVRHVRDHHRCTGVIMVTGFATVGGAVDAMRQGVDDYLPKPFSDKELRAAVGSALAKVKLRREIELSEPIEAPDGLIGDSAPMRRVYQLISRASRVDVPVLITGESGTGKELVARAIHYRGPSPSEPFLAVNCAAIPESLIESELFGHAKGAFTGATAARQGFFVAADGGTLFLDEVAELSPIAQAKLLRVLQDGSLQAVGSDDTRSVKVRIVAATNKDIEHLAADGHFREDLYFRLHVLPIQLPPLRDRGDDVVLLFRHFLALSAQHASTPTPRVTDAAIDAIRKYAWPGNVRELQNVVHRLVIFADTGVIDTVDLPAVMRSVVTASSASTTPINLNRTLREVERDHIRTVLESVGGNKTQAAAILGIDRKSLRAKLGQSDQPAHRRPEQT